MLSTMTMVINPSQPMVSGVFSRRFSQPMILVPHLGAVTYGNVWGWFIFSPSHPVENLASNMSQA